MKYPETFKKLIEQFECYPGVGPKTAERYAFYSIKEENKEKIENLIDSLKDSLDLIHECKVCGMITDHDICEICSDEARTNELMIVEDCKSVIAFEKIKQYNGKYHILNSLISPVNGVGPDDIGVDKILERVEKEKIEKIILAIPSNMDGEITSLYIKKMLSDKDVKLYRIGYGLPVDASVEFADDITLIKSLEGIKEL